MATNEDNSPATLAAPQPLSLRHYAGTDGTTFWKRSNDVRPDMRQRQHTKPPIDTFEKYRPALQSRQLQPVNQQVLPEQTVKPVDTGTPAAITAIKFHWWQRLRAKCLRLAGQLRHYHSVTGVPNPSSRSTIPAAHSLSEPQLRRLAKLIQVEGVRLNEVVQAGRLSEVALRRIISCHLRGGNVGQILAEELLQTALTGSQAARS